MAITLQDNARNAAADAIAALHNSGTIELKTSGGTSTAGNGEVATLTFGATAFGSAASGVATANAITDDSSATGGTTTQFYSYTSVSAPILSGSVSTSGADINLTSTVIAATETVSLSSLTLTQPAS